MSRRQYSRKHAQRRAHQAGLRGNRAGHGRDYSRSRGI